MALIDDPDADPALLGGRLEAWLRRQPGGAGRSVRGVEPASGANGFSNETWRVTLDAPHEVVALRLPPARTGFFPHYDLPRQYGFMQALQHERGLAITPLRWIETDIAALGRPFFASAWVEGRAAPDRPCYVREGWLVEASCDQRRRLWRSSVAQLARLAQVRWRGERLARFDWPDGGTKARAVHHLEHWQALAVWGRSQLPREDTRFFDELHAWLLRERPREEPAGVVWGDARFGNMLYRDFEPVALLDWELAVIGDPMLDIAYLLFHVFLMELLHGDAGTQARFSGFDDDETTLHQWCETAGRDPAGYRWCWLFNAWKLLAIWECKAALLLRTGHATLEEALAVRRAEALLPHVAAVWQSGADGAFVRRGQPPSFAPAPAAA